MNKKEILIAILFAAIPLFWYVPGQMIGKGDYFPYGMGPRNLKSDLYLWSSDNAGNPSALPSFALYEVIWSSLQLVTSDIGFLQITIYVICFAAAIISAMLLSKTVYPEEKVAPIVCGSFYVLNFFSLSILLNVGMIWTYAFLPLLLALSARALKVERHNHKYSIIFAIAFSIVGSVSSVNPTNIVLIVVSLAFFLFYFIVVAGRIGLKQQVKKLAILIVLTGLLSSWWMVPVFNYYVLPASTEFKQDVNVQSWKWTQERASFLNLFSLNGGWAWREEYSPYYGLYLDNAPLTTLLFLPFLVATLAMLFKAKRRFNSYLMIAILACLFLAKGLHEPLSNVNLFLYDHVPYMEMFREPVMKFTLIILPFLALLIAFSVSRTVWTLSRKFERNSITRNLLTGIIILTLVSSSLPVLVNPLQTKTEELPFSSYVEVPEYWINATDWLNRQKGDFRVLITPLDDYYQMPYVWGYYGADGFVERMIQKPVVTASYAASYKINTDTLALIDQLRVAILYNYSSEFKSILQLFDVRYILQRNDLDYEYLHSAGRSIVTNEEMRTFLTNQPFLKEVRQSGDLDIYEYTEVQQSFLILGASLQRIEPEVISETLSYAHWDFETADQIDSWKKATPEEQFSADCPLKIVNGSLMFEILNSTWGWKTLNSPPVTVQPEAQYEFAFSIMGENTHQVHLKIREYDEQMQGTLTQYVENLYDGSSDWQNVLFDYRPVNENTTFLQFQIWSGHEADTLTPNKIWIDNVRIKSFRTHLNTQLGEMLNDSKTDQMSTTANYERYSPTLIEVKVNSTRPFVFAIKEAADPSWRAYLNGELLQSIPVISAMNAYCINKTGRLQITIEYEPQKWILYCSGISVIAFALSVAYLTVDEIRVRKKTNL